MFVLEPIILHLVKTTIYDLPKDIIRLLLEEYINDYRDWINSLKVSKIFHVLTGDRLLKQRKRFFPGPKGPVGIQGPSGECLGGGPRGRNEKAIDLSNIILRKRKNNKLSILAQKHQAKYQQKNQYRKSRH